MPKLYVQIINTLIDQGWDYIPGHRGNKAKLIPPDPDKKPVTFASTPSDWRGPVKTIAALRRSGAVLDDAELERLTKAESRRRLRQALKGHSETAVEAVEGNVIPISTKGQFWRPAEPEPEPVIPAPLSRAERFAARQQAGNPDDARGTAYTLAQARDMLKQGYHVKKVIQRTGWGLNHLRDLIDASTGYYHFKH